MSLRTEPDQSLIEREQKEQDLILEQLRIQHSQLRRHEVLAAMSHTLANEQNHIDAYQVLRDTTTRDILQAQFDASERLDRVVWDKERSRTDVVDRILHDEQLQRTAVGSFIEQNDARSWALVEQVRLVEDQLGKMTRFELDRKQHSVDSQLVSIVFNIEYINIVRLYIFGFQLKTELSEKRMNLTCTLLDLLDQQEQRKKQVIIIYIYIVYQ